MDRLTYAQARRLVLIAGLGVLLMVAAVMYARRVDPIEVAATILFIPIFLAFVFGNVPGGIAGAVVAFGVYVLLRLPAIDVVGADRFAGLIASRGLAFLAFGVIGGWANRQLQGSLEKLELHDQIDDQTGLFNSRFLVQDIDLEMSRSNRYKTIFSLTVVDVPDKALGKLSRRKQRRVLRDLADTVKKSVRTVDRVAHGYANGLHRFALVLPETGQEGTQILTGRLADEVARYLSERGAAIESGDVGRVGLTFPMQSEEVQGLRTAFAEIARHEYPEAPEPEQPRVGPEARRAEG